MWKYDRSKWKEIKSLKILLEISELEIRNFIVCRYQH